MKSVVKNFIKNIRPFKSIHFILMASLGCYFSRNFQVGICVLCLIAIFFIWQYCIYINDVFDVEIDKIAHADRPLVGRTLSRRTYIIISIVLLAIVFVITIIIGWLSVVIAAIYIGLATLYSAPPLRLRQYIIQTMFIGAGSMLSFFLGYFSLNPTITGEAILIGVLIFLALSTGTVVKDYKDYEGDKAANVMTIFTKFGVNRGLTITYILLFITFLLPLVLIHQVTDIIVIISFAILTTVVFNKWKSVTHVFLFYFIILLYVFLRYEGFLIVF